MRTWILVLIAIGCCQAADEAHWGVQGDGGYFLVPSFIVDEIHTLPETPSVEGASFQAGVVRFNGRGAPNFALQYSQIEADIEGSIGDARGTASVRGSGSMRGFMATKYVNFFSNDRVSAGIGLGGGVGRLEASYTRRVSTPTIVVFSEFRNYDYAIPFFELIGRLDIRASRYATIGPFYGVRNGMFGGGVCVRIHFLR